MILSLRIFRRYPREYCHYFDHVPAPTGYAGGAHSPSNHRRCARCGRMFTPLGNPAPPGVSLPPPGRIYWLEEDDDQ